MEDKNSLYLLLIMLLVLIASIIGAVLYSNQEATNTIGGTEKRFTAKPGATREKAFLLASRRDPTEEDIGAGAGDRENRPREVRSLSSGPPAPGVRFANRVNALLDETASLTHGERLQALREALAEALVGEQAAIYTALARLYSAAGAAPGSLAGEYFAQARLASEDVAHRQQIYLEQAEALAQVEEWAALENVAASGLQLDADPENFSRLRLAFLRGLALAQQTQRRDAAAAYEELMDDILRRPAPNEREQELARIVGLQLTRIYRELNDEVAADKARTRVQRMLLEAAGLS